MFNSLRRSFALLGVIAVGATLFLAGLGLWALQRMNTAATSAFVGKDVVADILPPPMYLIEARLVLSQAVEGTLSPTDASEQLQRLSGEYRARVDHWTNNPPFGLESHLLGKQHEAALEFLELADRRVVARLKAGDPAAASTALREAHRLYLAHRAGVDESVLASNAFASQSMADFDTTRLWTAYITGACGALAIAMLLALAWWVLRSIEHPLTQCAALARCVAAGDLGSESTAFPKRTDVIGMLQSDLHEMRLQLARTVSEVRANAEGVATASAQIAHGNLDLSQHIEQQASALQQTAATMEQLGATVRLNAGNAQQADQLSRATSGMAVKGGDVVGQVVETMKEISESSRRIADITGTIDGIAFQTNILALNAAVEAARAGDRGRGFAVVAGEVRILARRSADAAREIKSLIGANVERVARGAELANQAGDTMSEAVRSIRRVADLVSGISLASQEQSSGVGQVGQAVGQMDRVTQRNAALVEESAAAAESLKRQAGALMQAVRVFKLERSARA